MQWTALSDLWPSWCGTTHSRQQQWNGLNRFASTMGRRDGEYWRQSRLKYGDVFANSLRKGPTAQWLWPKVRGNRP